MNDAKDSFGKHIGRNFNVWRTEALGWLKSTILPSPQSLKFVLMVSVFVLIAIMTGVSIYYYHWLGISVGILLTGIAFLEFGLMKNNMRPLFFLATAAIPLVVFLSWGIPFVFARVNTSSATTNPKAIKMRTQKKSAMPQEGPSSKTPLMLHPKMVATVETTRATENPPHGTSADKNPGSASQNSLPPQEPTALKDISPQMAASENPAEPPTQAKEIAPDPLSLAPVNKVGADLEFKVQCQHELNSSIRCRGQVWNTGSDDQMLSFKESSFAQDDLGNTQRIYLLSGVTFGSNYAVKLSNNAPINFSLLFLDKSKGSCTKLNVLSIHVRWGDHDYGDMIAHDVPVS